MQFAESALILAVAIFVVVIYVLRARRGSTISRHPYRDPYGDAPGAWLEP